MGARNLGVGLAIGVVMAAGMALSPSVAVAQGNVSFGEDSSLSAHIGLRGGLNGVAGWGFDNDATVLDRDGQEYSFPMPQQNPWVYPEYYGHFGLGGSGGLTLEFRHRSIVGFETGAFISRDRASGYVDKRQAGTGTVIARIESEQETTSVRIPLMLKAMIPTPTIRPYVSAGVEVVVQTSSDLSYTQDRQAGSYGTESDMDELNRRNQIETSTYPLLAGTLGAEISAGSAVSIPIELRFGWNLGHSRDMEERATYRPDSNEIIYDGQYAGHFGIYTGVTYRFDL